MRGMIKLTEPEKTLLVDKFTSLLKAVATTDTYIQEEEVIDTNEVKLKLDNAINLIKRIKKVL